MIKALLLNPLGPSLVLALGGLLLWPWRQNRRDPAVGWRSPNRTAGLLVALVVLLAGIALVQLRSGSPDAVMNLRFAWQPFGMTGGVLAWRVDGWNWFSALLLLCVTITALVLSSDTTTVQNIPGQLRRTLWLAAAALAFVFSDNAVTLACCWVALDGALALRLQPARAVEPAGRAWTIHSLTGLALLAALALLGEDRLQLSFSTGTQQTRPWAFWRWQPWCAPASTRCTSG